MNSKLSLDQSSEELIELDDLISSQPKDNEEDVYKYLAEHMSALV
jgi:hypothetical protein